MAFSAVIAARTAPVAYVARMRLCQRSGTNSLRPVTVRQVLNAVQPHSDAPFTFDGTELSQVCRDPDAYTGDHGRVDSQYYAQRDQRVAHTGRWYRPDGRTPVD